LDGKEEKRYGQRPITIKPAKKRKALQKVKERANSQT
jgi:hypothetical protein